MIAWLWSLVPARARIAALAASVGAVVLAMFVGKVRRDARAGMQAERQADRLDRLGRGRDAVETERRASEGLSAGDLADRLRRRGSDWRGL